WGSARLLAPRGDPLLVHPHVRGARARAPQGRRQAKGPSPRAWGSAARGAGSRTGHRSIPTCVGLGQAVVGDLLQPPGPSPHAWGSGLGGGLFSCLGRSIPTCVGLGLPDLRKLSPLPICNQNYRSDTRTCNNTVTLCGCPYGHGYSPTLTPAYAQHWLATLTSPEPNPM